MLKTNRCVLAIVAGLAAVAIPALAADDGAPSQVLFKNVRVFDGTSDMLSSKTDVLVEGNKIKAISGNAAQVAAGAKVIDGEGRVLMPGLIESHAHLAFPALPVPVLLGELPSYAVLHSADQVGRMLMRGVTTARDLGGEVFGLKKAIDEGLIPGPRIYPSGPLISQTSGHGDFRTANEQSPLLNGPLPPLEKMGQFRVADGVARVLSSVRENLRLGASQIKLAAGGGYASPADPIDTTQFSQEEIEAAVGAAADWGTYVTVHAYTPRAINRAIDAGVKVIEHGQLLDRKTLERMADEGIWLSTQPFTVCNEPQLSAFSNEKLAVVCKGTEFVYDTIRSIPKLKVTYGTDIFNDPVSIEKEIEMMERLLKWYKPVEILRMATGNTADLLKLSGPRNPYPGDLGVVKQGAYADLLLVDGNPLEDLKAVTNQQNLKVIMKDGKIFKNTLD